jgi:hypothetical protein
MKSPCAVNLHNAVTVSQQNISTTIRKTRGPAEYRTDEFKLAAGSVLSGPEFPRKSQGG